MSNQGETLAGDEETASAISRTLNALAVDNASLLPIDLERVKVRTLERRLARCQDEIEQLKSMLKQTQADLERQIQQTILIQKKQLIRTRITDLNEEPVVPVQCDDIQALKDELALTHKDFADELELSKKREGFLRQIVYYFRHSNAVACSSVIIPLLTPSARTLETFVLLFRVLSITSSSSFI